MTATYTAWASDKDRVRFHVGDTAIATPINSDEDITATITEAGGWQLAVIWLIDARMASLSNIPSFTADWLRIENDKAIAALTKLREQKCRQFGIASIDNVSMDTINVYRTDSLATESPSYRSE